MEKSGGAAFTVRVAIALRLSVPLVPLIVRRKLPTGVAAEVTSVNVEDPAPVTEGGLKVIVVPAGAPATVKTTLLEKPLTAAVETVNAAVPPTLMPAD